MWHRTPSRQPSSVLQKPQTSGVRDVSASPVNHSPYYGDMAPTLRGDNSTAGGQYIPESIASPRSMSSTDDRLTQQQQQQMSGGLPYTNHNGNDYNDHNGHGASSRTSISMNSSNIDRVDSNSSINHIQSTPRTSSTAKRLTSLFSRKRRSTSQVRPNGGEGVDSRSNASPAPAVGAGNATVQNGANGHGGNSRPDASDGDGYSGDMVVGDEEYPYGYDNTHGYYDPNSYYYPGDTAYSNAATAEHGALPRRTASASGNQNNHKGLGNNTSVGSQGRRSGEFANGDSGHNGSSSNGNNGNGRNGGSSIVNGSVGAGPQRRHSAGVTQHGAQLNQIEEDDDEYFEVSPVDQYPETYGNAGRRSVDYIAPNSKEAEALAEAGIPLDHSPAQYSHHPQSPSGAMNGGSGLSASAFSQANPLAKSVLRQQMQKQQWLSQQQLGLQQYAAAHQQQSTQMQIQMAQQPTTPGGTTVRPPLPPPIPQLARGGWAGVGAGGGGGAEWQESASPEPQQQQQRQQLQQRYGQPPQPQHASLEDRVTDFKGGPNVSVNTLGNHPLLRDQAQHGRFEHQNHSHSQSGTPIQDQEEHPQPPRLPPKEPLSRGSSAQDAPNALNHNSNLANNNTPDANSTMSPTAAVTPSNRMKSPGQLPQFPQQQHAQQRQYQSSQPPGIQGKAGSPYTPYSLYTQSSTPDIPHRDTRRSTDYSAELDPMAMWQQEQKGQQGGHYPQQGQYQHGQQQRDFHQPYSPDQHDQNSVPPVEQQQHEHQHYQDNSQAKAVDQRIQSPRSMFLTNPDGTTVEASALSTPAAHDGGGRYTQWPLTPLAMPLVSEAMVPPLKPRSDWDRSCLDYFLSKYRDRLEAKNWEKEPFREILGVPAYPSDAALASSARLCSPLSDAGDHDDLGNGMDDILPHLLHDRLFYLAYAITGSSKSTYSHQLWELFGASNPGHLLTVYAALAATNGTPASSASSEPVDLDEFLVAAVEGVKRGDSGATRLSTADKPEDVSMESLLNMVTRRLDEPGTSPYDFVLRQVKSQLRLMKGEMATRFGADSGWRTRIPLKFDRSSSKASSSAQCLPLYHGLQLYLASKQHLIRTAMQRTCAQLPDLSALLGSTITPTNQDTSTTDSPQIPAKIADTGEQNAVVASGRPRTVTLLLDVPGSGKTRLMRDKILEAHGNSGGGGGMYFMAPNLPPPFSSSPSSPSASLAIRTTSPKLLEVARSSNISRDTYSLYQDLSYLERSGIGGGARPVLGIAGIPHNRIVKSETCLDPLFRARKHLLDMLDLEVRGTKWAQLQMASPSGSGREQNGSDLFDLAYRFMRLQHDEKPPALPARPGAAAATARESTNAETDTQPHLIVIDEAQAVIGDPLAERILRGMIDSCRAGGQTYVVGTRPLAHVVHQPQMGFLRKASLPDHSNGSDAASTSQQHQQLDREDLIIRRMPCSKVHVDNAETFWSVLVHHAWSLVGEIYELRAQGFLKAGITGTKVNENGNEIDRSNIQSEHQVTDKHGTNYKIGSIQNSGDDNYDPSSSVPAHHLRNGHHHNNDSVRPRPRQLREIPLLTREGQILSFDINLPVVNGGSSGNAGSNSNSAAANWADLEASLQTWNVLNSTARDETIDREGTRFFGRVRWTATFAEELLRASSMVGKRNGYNSVVGNHNATTATTGGGRLSPEGVRAAAQRAAGRIKAGLRQRLDDVRGTRCADELIWAALEADVFGASRWFEGPLAADLVAAGFALVEEEDSSQVNNAGSAAGNGNSSLAADAVYGEKSGDVGAGQLERSASRAVRISHDRSRPDGPIRARLAEPLVVEAVVEYLYESPVEVLDKYLRRFFTPMQTDSADRECLWKIAEDVLAKKLHNTIRLTSDTVSQHRRTGFFDVLRHSRSPTPIHKLRRHSSSMQQNSFQVQKPLSHHDYWTYGEAERFVGSLDRYYLKDSGVNIDRRGEWLVEDWLYEEEEEHRPNFFFADGGEGYGNDMDDGGALGCLFFLQDRDNSRRKILCVLQFAPAPAPEMTTSTPEPNTTANGETGAMQPQHPAASPFPALTNLITNLWSNHPVNTTTGHVQTPWPVFYIYIPPPSTEIDDDAFVAELSQGAARGKMPRNHYVGYVDISNSDGIWGTTFPAWIGQMAEEKRRAVQRQRVEQQQKMAMRRRG